MLPSLWEQVNGSPATTGRCATPTGRSCAGPRRWASSGARRTSCRPQGLAASASTSRGSRPASRRGCCRCSSPHASAPEPARTKQTVVAAIDAEGPLTGPQLRDLTGLPKKDVDRLVARCTAARPHERPPRRAGRPWGAIAHDLLARKWTAAERLPGATRRAASSRALVLEQAGELTAADLAGPFGWRRKRGGGGARRDRRGAATAERLPHLDRDRRLRAVTIAELAEDRVVEAVYAVSDEAQAADEVRRLVPRARARRPDGPHRGARLERRRAARRALRRGRRRARARPRREVPRPAAARRALARSGGRRPGVADAGDAARRATSSRASSSFSSPRSRIPGLAATVRAVLADCDLARLPGDARRPPLLRRRAARAHGRRRDALPRDGAAAPAPARRPAARRGARCTTSAERSSSGAARRSPSPTRAGCSATSTSALRLIEERAEGLTARAARGAPALRRRRTTTRAARERPRRRCSTTRTSSTRSPRPAGSIDAAPPRARREPRVGRRRLRRPAAQPNARHAARPVLGAGRRAARRSRSPSRCAARGRPAGACCSRSRPRSAGRSASTRTTAACSSAR